MTGGGKCAICKIAGVLAGIGALNWGLVGVFQFDLIARVLGEMTGATRAVYTLAGIGGLVTLLSIAGCCPCTKKGCETK